MNRRYVCYGLHILADSEIPGLIPSAFPSSADVRIHLNEFPEELLDCEWVRWYQSPWSNREGRPNLTIWRTTPAGVYHFAYDDRTEFLIQADGSQVWCTWPEGATAVDTAVYLRGSVLGFVLRLRGVVSLHASAIAVGGCAIAILGAAGAGKSTTAAAFVQCGFPLLTDDITALRREGRNFQVLPGYPRLNLWPDAVATLRGSRDALPRLTPTGGINAWWDKRYLDLEMSRQFHRAASRLAAVYVLGERSADDRAPYIQPLSPRSAFMAIADRTYVNYALDESMRAMEFHVLADLVQAVPVLLLTPHSSQERLPSLCKAILEDYSRLETANTRV